MELQKYKVILTHPIPTEWLAGISDEVEFVCGPDGATGFDRSLLPHLPDADGIISLLSDAIDEYIIYAAPRLKVICNYAAGTDNIDLKACSRRKIPVGITPGVLTDSTADLAMGLILAACRLFTEAGQAAKAGDWKMWYPARWLGKELSGATLGIIGMGRIGQAVALRAQAFGMRIVYYSRTRNPEIEAKHGFEFLPFVNLLEQSDIVSLHAPLTDHTRQIMDTDAFNRMKTGSILVNTARGAEVDSMALYDALVSGKLMAAGLDVTDPEPLPPDHPLYRLRNCIILPHIGSATVKARRKMAEKTCSNLIAGLKGSRLPFCANPDVYEVNE